MFNSRSYSFAVKTTGSPRSVKPDDSEKPEEQNDLWHKLKDLAG